ncbi:4187_t:CDS:2, partial [Cetraspora pellucida]
QGPLFIHENPACAYDKDKDISLLKNVVLEPEATTVSRVPNTTPSSASMCGVVAPTNKAIYKLGKKAQKGPPRPPNAFILYRREKQSEIMTKFPGYTNNEVSKEIGRMWSEESQEVRSIFQQMADAAKQEHMEKQKDSSSNRVSTSTSHLMIRHTDPTDLLLTASIDFQFPTNYQPIFVDCPLISSPLSYLNLSSLTDHQFVVEPQTSSSSY